MDWTGNEPIYRQLQHRLEDRILDGDLKEGDALPSVKTLSTELGINPLTVSKACQFLVDQGWAEKRRGLGLFVRPGARDALKASVRARFLKDEWPQVAARLRRLGLGPKQLDF